MTNEEVKVARFIHDKLCQDGSLPVLAILPPDATDTLYDALSYNLGDYTKNPPTTWITGQVVISTQTVKCPYCELTKG